MRGKNAKLIRAFAKLLCDSQDIDVVYIKTKQGKIGQQHDVVRHAPNTYREIVNKLKKMPLDVVIKFYTEKQGLKQ